jgi:tRNA-modifying protein YgfZ
MIILQQEQRALLVTDMYEARRLPEMLDQYLFSEDVQMADLSMQHEQISLHGPASALLLQMLGASSLDTLEPLTHRQVTLAGRKAAVYRRDEAGAPGLHLVATANDAAVIYAAAVEALGGLTPEVEGGVRRTVPGRGIGWLAYNTARIEAGTPLFRIDFGSDSLPHETGVLEQAVSFTKGCYIGQEIVARMHHLGHPKRVLVGLKFSDDRLPIAGAQVFNWQPAQPPTAAGRAGGGDVIGGITSSTLSPLLGNVAIAFAVVRWGKHTDGAEVAVPAEGTLVAGVVGPLRFVP